MPLHPPKVIKVIEMASDDLLQVGVSYRTTVQRARHVQHFLDLTRAGPRSAGQRVLIDRAAIPVLRQVLDEIEAAFAEFPPENVIEVKHATDTERARAYRQARVEERRRQRGKPALSLVRA